MISFSPKATLKCRIEEKNIMEKSPVFEKENIDPSQMIPQKSSEDQKKDPLSKKIKHYLPIFLFLPLIILVSSDAALLLTNQIQIIISFNIIGDLGFVGTVVGISLVAKAISTIFFGYMSDKYSRKKILIMGSLVWIFGEFMVSISPTRYFLLGFRVLASAGSGAATPVTMSLLADIFSTEKRGNSFAWWGLAATVGELGGGSIGLVYNPIQSSQIPANITSFLDKIYYIQAHYSAAMIDRWRIPFLLMAILGCIFIVLIFFVKEPRRGSTETTLKNVVSEELDYSKNYKIKFQDLKYIYKRKSNFWLIINFVDTIFSGLLLGFFITWITIEVGFDFSASSLAKNGIYMLSFVLILVVFFLWGQFFFARIGDKKFRAGDYAGRVKVAIFCGIVQIPFLILGFLFAPNVSNRTFFMGKLQLSNNSVEFGLLMIAMAVVLGLGVGLWTGVGPNWYASMMDVNLPEHRGTMIASAAFMDAIGRAIGATLGGHIIDYFTNQGSAMPITDTIIFTVGTFGVISAILWLPILKYCRKDFKEVHDILEERAKILEKKKEEMEFEKQLKQEHKQAINLAERKNFD